MRDAPPNTHQAPGLLGRQAKVAVRSQHESSADAPALDRGDADGADAVESRCQLVPPIRGFVERG